MIKERGRDIQRGKNSMLGDVVFGWSIKDVVVWAGSGTNGRESSHY